MTRINIPYEDLKYDDLQKVIIKTACIDLIVLDEQGKEIYRHLMPTDFLVKDLFDRRKAIIAKQRGD